MNNNQEERYDCRNCKHSDKCDKDKKAFYKFVDKQCEEWEKEDDR